MQVMSASVFNVCVGSSRLVSRMLCLSTVIAFYSRSSAAFSPSLASVCRPYVTVLSKHLRKDGLTPVYGHSAVTNIEHIVPQSIILRHLKSDVGSALQDTFNLFRAPVHLNCMRSNYRFCNETHIPGLRIDKRDIWHPAGGGMMVNHKRGLVIPRLQDRGLIARAVLHMKERWNCPVESVIVGGEAVAMGWHRQFPISDDERRHLRLAMRVENYCSSLLDHSPGFQQVFKMSECVQKNVFQNQTKSCKKLEFHGLSGSWNNETVKGGGGGNFSGTGRESHAACPSSSGGARSSIRHYSPLPSRDRVAGKSFRERRLQRSARLTEEEGEERRTSQDPGLRDQLKSMTLSTVQLSAVSQRRFLCTLMPLSLASRGGPNASQGLE